MQESGAAEFIKLGGLESVLLPGDGMCFGLTRIRSERVITWVTCLPC